MPEPTRQYLFSEGQVRSAFIASGIGAVALLVGLLILASARPQGRLAPADTLQHQQTLEEAAALLSGYEILDGGAARIDIDRAMALVVERGVADPFSASAPAPAADTADADTTGGGEGADAPVAQAAEELPDGAQVYGQCVGCHQANGQGIPGAFPPLAEHMPVLYNAEGGRDYLISTMLYGLQGEIVALGQSYNGLMPAWPQLSDAEIAAVLNHELTEWGNDQLVEDFEPYTADDIAARRGEGLTGADVLEQRQALELP